MQQLMQRPMLQAPQKPTFATVPDAINIQPFDASKYAANIQQPMQRAFELQKNVADQREAERQQVMAQNAQKQQQYEQQLQAYNQQRMQSKYPQQQQQASFGDALPYIIKNANNKP